MLKLDFSEQWLSQQDAMALLASIERIIDACAISTEQQAGSVEVLSRAAREHLLASINQTDMPFPLIKPYRA